ncbi:acyltransferase [Moritella sp. 24]|uniref:acyltransferase family protein n=1 Tax=Moritella sp. 24 TaxID=2746230 RepID=UPI001BA690BF|nr:acyltransferase family protein [Moritella sp. 24]QUM77878.1 acyltransferase [Moritella sp. 24]
MKFRKDINGLRAIAVIAVVLFHFNNSWLPGGFSGVDVFFVISGFLMTKIIFTSLDLNKFSVFKFYMSRADRILPPLIVLCLTLIIFGWYFLPPLDYKALGKHIASSLGFISNFIYWNESGYFSSSSNEKWLLHTWSLSAEWQFYILYPVVLATGYKSLSLKYIKFTIFIGCVAGFLFCIFASNIWSDSSYYLLPTRIWEMLLGGVAYLYPINFNKEKHKKIIEYIGFSLILLSYFFITEDNVWPGYLAIFPTLGAFFVIQAQRNNSLLTNNLLFQYLGSWSYSIYLWHWPIVVGIYYFSLSGTAVIIGMFLSLLLGFLSYRYIESKSYKSNFKTMYDCFKSKIVFTSVILALIGSVIYFNNGFNTSFRDGASTPQAKFLDYYSEAHANLDDAYWLKCDYYDAVYKQGNSSIDFSCFERKYKKGVFLWGDSHAEALSLGIRDTLKPLNISFYQVTSAGCKPSLSKSGGSNGELTLACDLSNELALEKMTILKPDLVIMSQAGMHEETNWNEIYNYLRGIGVKNILLIGPVSQWRPSLPKVMIKPEHWNSLEPYINDDFLDMDIINTDLKMKLLEPNFDFQYISLIDDLCYFDDDYFCRVKSGDDTLLQVDYGHLSASGSKFVSETILRESIIKYL